MPERDTERVTYARRQLESLRRQREGLDNAIAEFEAFLRVWDATESALAKSNGSESPRAKQRREHSHKTLWDYIAEALVRGGRKGMDFDHVAEMIAAAGFKYSGKMPLRAKVGNELFRQQNKIRRKGLRRVSKGVYAYQPEG